MLFDAETDLKETWETAPTRRRWLRTHEDELRRIAAGAGWSHVAEALESRGWSVYWQVRPLTPEILSREMAQIAFRSRARGTKPLAADRRLAQAVAEAMHPIAEKIVHDVLTGRAALAPSPAHAAAHMPAAHEDKPAPAKNPAPVLPATGEIKVPASPEKRLTLDPKAHSAALAGIGGGDFEIPTKKKE